MCEDKGVAEQIWINIAQGCLDGRDIEYDRPEPS